MAGTTSSGSLTSQEIAMHSSKQELLLALAKEFGEARLVTNLTRGLRPKAITTAEVKGDRDSAWRPVGLVGEDPSVNGVLLCRSLLSKSEDSRRVAHLYADVD
jgi:hypothetical protein